MPPAHELMDALKIERGWEGVGAHSPTQFITEIESVSLANLFIRLAWKTTASLIAMTYGLFRTIE